MEYFFKEKIPFIYYWLPSDKDYIEKAGYISVFFTFICYFSRLKNWFPIMFQKKKKKQNYKQNNIIADMIKFWNQQETANEFTFNLWPSSFREIKLRFFFISYNSMNLLCKIKIDLLIHVFIQFHYKYLSNMANLNICYISDIEQWGSWVKKRYRLNHEKSICPFFLAVKNIQQEISPLRKFLTVQYSIVNSKYNGVQQISRSVHLA